VFGIIRPCRHRLGGELGAAWLAHLCGLCLSLRDDHGQAARIATNYDGLVISLLAEAQQDSAPERRAAGRCALRGMRKASVATGECARLAATVSLVLAAAKIRDHADDGDGMLGRPGVRGAAKALAAHWTAASARSGREIGFETGVLTAAIGRQADIEAAAGPGTCLLTVTEPTETATAAAFAHTAVLAGRPGNAAPLAEAGKLFGRLAHLLDAVEDLSADQAGGTWNPLLATGSDLAEARRLCDDALLGIKLALAEADFADGRLVHALLVHELARSVERIFSRAGGHGTAGLSVAGVSAAGAAAGCGLALPGLFALPGVRHRRFGCCRCGEDCCCECGEDCCCECSCECCGDACCDSCCDGCDCSC
jgi:hypothetical protein